MTTPVLNDVTPFNQYTATGGQTTFPYTFLIYQASDINVFKKSANAAPDDEEQLLQLGVDYTLTGIGVDSGGNVILTVGATLNDIITASRSTALSRQTDFVPGNLTADTLNLEFNNLLAMVQDIAMLIAKIIPNYNLAGIFNQANMKLPQLAANQLWQMNSLGTGIGTVNLTETDPGATILRSDLASSAVGKGASLVSLEDGQTVQDFADGLENNVFYGLDISDTPDVIKVNFSPAITSYEEGKIYIVRFKNDGTGAATISLNGLAFLSLNYPAGYDLQLGDILQYKVGVITYVANNGSPYFQLLNPDFEAQIVVAGIRKALTASVYMSVPQAISTTSALKVAFNIPQFDDNFFWDDVNKRLILNKLGKFRIDARIITTVNANTINLCLYVNGALSEVLDQRGYTYSGGGAAVGGTVFKNTDVDTYVEIFIVSDAARGIIAVSSRFSIEYLGTN